MASNYWTVSLTPMVFKLLDAILRDIFMDFLVRNNLISTKQHGFVKKACVRNLLLKTLYLISRKLADGDCVFIQKIKIIFSKKYIYFSK